MKLLTNPNFRFSLKLRNLFYYNITFYKTGYNKNEFILKQIDYIGFKQLLSQCVNFRTKYKIKEYIKFSLFNDFSC